MMKFYFRVLQVLVTLNCFCATALRAEGVWVNLLERTSRPRVHDVLEVLQGKSPDRNPIEVDFNAGWSIPGRSFNPTKEQFRELLRLEVPLTIARMEKAFPGARWVAVGRDASTLGDVLDAFYISIGQPGRVKFLSISTGSYGDTTLFLRYLRELGVPKNEQELAHAVPIVFLDRTSYGTWRASSSQQILHAAYTAYAGDKVGLVRMVNFLTTEPVTIAWSSASSSGINGDLVTADNVDSFLESQRVAVKQLGMPSRFSLYLQI